MKKIMAFVFLVLAFVTSFFGNFNFTGRIISENYFNFLPLNLIAIAFLLISILMFTNKKSLDAIIIPTGGHEKNIERAKRGEEKEAKYYLISGHINKNNPIKESQTAEIYNELRKYGIKPSQMKIEGKSKDSLDNIMYSLEKLKGMKNIGIVSYPKHLKRFEYIIEKAKKEKIIPSDLEITYIPTNESSKEKIYGFLALLKEKYRLRKGINQGRKKKSGFLGQIIKKITDPGTVEE